MLAILILHKTYSFSRLASLDFMEALEDSKHPRFQQKDIPWRAVLRHAKEDANEWKQSDLLNTPYHHRRGGDTTTEENKRWKRPPLGWIKCNTDGSFRQQLDDATAGWILRDDNGVYKGSVQARGKRVQDALESELQAILMAIQHCWSLGYKQVIIESDCQKAIDILNNKKLHFNHYNWIREIRWWARKFQSITFNWVSRKANGAADILAKRVEDEVVFQFHYYVPQFLHVFLHMDHVSSI